MAEVAAVAGVYGLITGSIAFVRSAIDIYVAVRDKSGIPERLRKVSEKLKPLEGLLESAKHQYDGQKLDQKIWHDAENDLKRCQELCHELHDLLVKVYPEDEATKSVRFWTSAKAVLGGKSKTAEQLLKEIWMYLDVFEKKGIVTNMALLRDIKDTVDELFPSSGSTLNHSGSGDNVAGDKFTGNKYQQGDNGRQIFGSIGTYHEVFYDYSCALQSVSLTDGYLWPVRIQASEFILAAFFVDPVEDLLSQDMIGSSVERDPESVRLDKLQNWLAFPGMHERERDLAEPATETFGWILPVNWEKYADEIVPDDNAKTFRAGSAFVSWLQSTDQLFWVSGKPGSGKSTLMKHLWNQESLRSHLEKWAGGRQLQRSSHYFWKIGGGEQNTIRGLYRSLLYKLCRSQDGERFVKMALESWDPKSSSPEPSMGELRHAMRELLSKTKDSVAFCFLIDGLDECLVSSNDHHQLCEVLSKDFLVAGHRDNVKLIVSSRPDPPFGDTYSQSRHLVMQDLTRKDIRQYVLQFLQEGNTRLILQSADLEQISSAILDNSNGVFLWTVLVIRRLRSSMMYEYDPKTLVKEVYKMPHEIDDLIGSIVGNVPSKVSPKCKELLVLLRKSQVLTGRAGRYDFLSATALASAAQWYSQPHYAEREPGDVRHYATPHLRGVVNQTHGLLELCSSLRSLREHDYREYASRKNWPKFMHRTVADWVDANLMEPSEADEECRKQVFLKALCRGMLDDLAICIQKEKWGEDDKVNRWFSSYIYQFLVLSNQFDAPPLNDLMSLLDCVCSDNLDQLVHLSRRHLETQSEGEPLGVSSIKHWSALCIKSRADWLHEEELYATPMLQYMHAGFLEATDILLFALESVSPSYFKAPSIENQIRAQHEHRGVDFLHAALIPQTYMTSRHEADPKIVASILALGCDPNRIHKKSSVWHEYLRYLVTTTSRLDVIPTLTSDKTRDRISCIELFIIKGADTKSSVQVCIENLQERLWTPGRIVQWLFLDRQSCCTSNKDRFSMDDRHDPFKAQVRYRNIMRCTCPVARSIRPDLEHLFSVLDIQDWSRSDWAVQSRTDQEFYEPKLCDNHRRYGPYWDNDGCTNFTGSHCDWTRPSSAVPTARWYLDDGTWPVRWVMEMEPDSLKDCVHNPKMPTSTATKTTQGASRWREWLHMVLYVVLLMILGPIFTAAMFAWLVVQFRAITLLNFVATNR